MEITASPPFVCLGLDPKDRGRTAAWFERGFALLTMTKGAEQGVEPSLHLTIPGVRHPEEAEGRLEGRTARICVVRDAPSGLLTMTKGSSGSSPGRR